MLCALVVLAACTEPRSPSGGSSCDPTATSDNGCSEGMACSPFHFDDKLGQHVALCEPGGPADEGQPCGPKRKCRAGHACNIIPNTTAQNPEEPGTCFRFCNVDMPVCPGSTCSQLAGSGKTQWLMVDGIRYGICGGFGHTRFL